MRSLNFIILCLLLAGGSAVPRPAQAASTEHRNVLLICIDDLRPELKCYGAEHMLTPNIDKLSKTGVTFDRCYVQVAVCNPSRASTWTGLRPDTLNVYTLRTHFRETKPDAVTLFQHLRKHGYTCEGFGKIFHNPWQDPRSWDVEHTWGSGSFTHYSDRQKAYQAKVRRELPEKSWQKGNLRGVITNDPDVADSEHTDGSMAIKSIERMKKLKAGDKPFLLAVGFVLPHLPWAPPKSWWDKYDRNEIPLAKNPFPPKGAPEVAVGTNYELSHYADMVDMPTPFSGSLPEKEVRRLRHAYVAAISFIDAQVGRLLDALEEQGLADDTAVVLWSDHGYKLGEHNGWSKMTNYEIDTRIPFIIRDPGAAGNGKRSRRIVESLDVFPTICDLAKVPVPDFVEGKSMKALLEDPEAEHKGAAFSQYIRSGMIGHGVRTDRWRYVEWRKMEDGKLEFTELYDQVADPDENTNVAASHLEEIKDLAKLLRGTLDVGPVNLIAKIRSGKGGKPVSFRFINGYDGAVKVTWINPQGHRLNTTTLRAGVAREHGSFVGHVFSVESLDGKYHELVRIQEGQGDITLK